MSYDENDVVVYDTVNIEDIQVGDLVYSYNTIAGEVELKAVTKTIALTSEHVRYITLENEVGDTQTLETTDSHPFWVVTDDIDLSRAARSMVDENGVWLYHDNISPTDNGYWVEAKDLRVGDVVMGANGELSIVQSTMRVDIAGGISVFNLEVEGNHNYFVLAKEFEYGQTCVLVHNACPNKLSDKQLKDICKKIEDGFVGKNRRIKDYFESEGFHHRRLSGGEIPHVHFKAPGNNIALNMDGTWKHKPPTNWNMPQGARTYLLEIFKPYKVTIDPW